MSKYIYVWREELIYAVAIFILYVGTSLAALQQSPDNWKVWAMGVVAAAGRVVLAGILPKLAAFVAKKPAS